MVNNLDDALKALGWAADYQYINIGKLPAKGPHGLPDTDDVKGKDLFGMSVPKPPYDVPSCRVCRDAVPSSNAIAAALRKAKGTP